MSASSIARRLSRDAERGAGKKWLANLGLVYWDLYPRELLDDKFREVCKRLRDSDAVISGSINSLP